MRLSNLLEAFTLKAFPVEDHKLNCNQLQFREGGLAPAPNCPDDCEVPYLFLPIANKLADDRTYITPSDNAGVAINNSPIEFVPR